MNFIMKKKVKLVIWLERKNRETNRELQTIEETREAHRHLNYQSRKWLFFSSKEKPNDVSNFHQLAVILQVKTHHVQVFLLHLKAAEKLKVDQLILHLRTLISETNATQAQ